MQKLLGNINGKVLHLMNTIVDRFGTCQGGVGVGSGRTRRHKSNFRGERDKHKTHEYHEVAKKSVNSRKYHK